MNDRMNEIEERAQQIIGNLADLQLAVLHHPNLASGDGRVAIYEKLMATKALAATMMRREMRPVRPELDPTTAMRIQLVNGFNAMAALLRLKKNHCGLGDLERLDLDRIRNMAAAIVDRVDAYREMSEEAADARPAA